jgi:deoxyribonuclease IV
MPGPMASKQPKKRATLSSSVPLLLGAHMSIAGGPSKALERGHSIGCTAVQVFVKNNMQWFAKPFAEKDLNAYLLFPDRPKIVFGHSSYLINPAATNPDFLEKSIQALGEELVRADQLKLPFLVLHPGAHMGAGETSGLKRVSRSLDQVFKSASKTACKIALEITAGQGTCLGCTFEQLATILAQSKHPERLAICLDTAHLFASGFDISSEKGFWNTIKSFDQIVGRERLVAWHLNDSKTPLGSKVDRHEHIGKGKIGLAPFREIMNAPEFAEIPKVLETPKKEDLKEDIVNLGVLKSLLQV